MASKNQLLGSGKIEVDEETGKVTVVQFPSLGLPAWRYHKNCPSGIVVKTEVELARLEVEGGWVDHPGKVSLLPGHENMYEGEVGN
jgi:hypothetical protein